MGKGAAAALTAIIAHGHLLQAVGTHTGRGVEQGHGIRVGAQVGGYVDGNGGRAAMTGRHGTVCSRGAEVSTIEIETELTMSGNHHGSTQGAPGTHKGTAEPHGSSAVGMRSRHPTGAKRLRRSADGPQGQEGYQERSHRCNILFII